jgi:uncharacterized protein (DUF983 family)
MPGWQSIYDELPKRPVWPAMWRGFQRHCPECGKGSVFSGYTKVKPVCSHCGLELHHQRADDSPAYFTLLIVGHLIVSSLVITEKIAHPPVWLHMVIWLPLCVALSLFLLPRIKGALIALQWALRMHGFGDDVPAVVTIAEPEPWT